MSPIDTSGPTPEEMGIKPKEQLDTQWYERFEKFGAFQAYEYLDGDKKIREEQKNKFLSGEIENPALDYPKIDLEKLITIENELIQLKVDIKDQEMNEVVKQAYIWRINEKIAETRMLTSAGKGDMKWFQRWSKFVYGSPSPEVFAYTIQSLRESISTSLSSNNEQIVRIVEELN